MRETEGEREKDISGRGLHCANQSAININLNNA